MDFARELSKHSWTAAQHASILQVLTAYHSYLWRISLGTIASQILQHEK